MGVALALEAVGVDAGEVLGPLPEGVEDARAGREGDDGAAGGGLRLLVVLLLLLGRREEDKDVVPGQVGLGGRERLDVRGDPLGAGPDALGPILVVVGAVAGPDLGAGLALHLLEAGGRGGVGRAVDLVPVPLLDGLEVRLVVEAAGGGGRRLGIAAAAVEVGMGPAPGVGPVPGLLLGGARALLTPLGVLLVVKVGRQAVLGDLVHLSRPDLDLQRPVLSAPPRRRRVVQALVSVGLGTIDVVLEPAPVAVEVGFPVRGAQALDVVAQRPLAGGGDLGGLVGRLLPGVEDDAEGQGVGDVEEAAGSGPEDLPPKAVGFLDAGGDDDVGGRGGEGGVGIQHGLDVGGHPSQDAGHPLPDGEGGTVGRVAVGVVVVQNEGLAAHVHDPIVLPAVLQTEGGGFQFVLEAVHPQAAGEGGVDVEGVAALPHLLGGEGGGGGAVGISGRLQSAEAVEARRGADGQRPPVPRLGQQEVLHVGGGVPAAALAPAEGGPGHGLGPLETAGVRGDPGGLVGRAAVVLVVLGVSSSLEGRVEGGAAAVQVGVAGREGPGRHLEHLQAGPAGQ